MKVLVIMGSPRKGNTYHAAERIREILQEKDPVEWEYVMLRDINLEQCRGCFLCLSKGEEFCPLKEDESNLEVRMREADGVVFASPVYGMQVSGLMKVFIDRHSYIFHRPRFFDQKAMLLTTTGAVGAKEVLDYLEFVARIWGFDVAARVGIQSSPTLGPLPRYRMLKNERELRAAAEAFHAALNRGTRSRPKFRDVIVFHAQRAAFDELGETAPADHSYWADQGWLEAGRRYFVDVPVNPLYSAIGNLIEWSLRRRVRKDIRETG
jgi:multimeric flavodoxin WrbA